MSEPDQIVEFAQDADAIIVQYAQVSRETLQRLPKCKVVSRYGIGIDNIDVQAAKELGIYVAYNPQYCIDEVSDHAVAMIMSLHRQISFGTDQVRKGIWDYTKLIPIKATSETTIGIFGFGNIGRRVASKVKELGYKCTGFDPYLDDMVFDDLGIQRVSMEQLFSKSDFITIHCSLTPETRGIIDEEAIWLMKKGAYIVNTSRGAVINIDALVTALSEERLGGAALDVLPEEPPKSLDPIVNMPSVLLTPHLAFYSETSIIELRSSIAEQVVEVMQGKVPRYNAY